ncbi:hypothetical protein [Aquimarina sp. MMG016]|uniref:hypothetical protein n=1 Tax=Aquimarina sp. MMG016 TaxID=2822690 RepID=UPI001B3A1157|nr:hypothetical protein [Aquimarina sp. MMG016]MBQ4822180.1 hypothetical protein [Aquimarina sp. MMG016]
MQITKLLGILLISSIFLTSCSNDDDNDVIVNPLQINNKQPLGTSANDLLSSVNFKSLTIEMVSVQGFEPTNNAVENFKSFLEQRLFKPDGITINQRSVASSNLNPFTNDEITQIENNTRTAFNVGDDITVYIYFADGSSVNDTETNVTLGTAYLNTSIVIYENTIRRLGNRPNGPTVTTIETAALNHEFAHLLGLVNIGTTLQSSHEDPGSRGHCNVEKCLMEASIEFGSGMMEMLGKGVPELDPLCIADLQANGGR